MLDKSKPYAEVHGLPGAVYEQGGKLYGFDGQPANPNPYNDDVEVPPEDVFIPGPVCYEQPTLPPELENGRNIEDMPLSLLKKLVENYGGKWEGKKAALEFLKGKQ